MIVRDQDPASAHPVRDLNRRFGGSPLRVSQAPGQSSGLHVAETPPTRQLLRVIINVDNECSPGPFGDRKGPLGGNLGW